MICFFKQRKPIEELKGKKKKRKGGNNTHALFF